MIKLDCFTKNRLFLISTGLWIVILFVVIILKGNNDTSARQSIKYITHQKDSLKTVVIDREKKIKELTEIINRTEVTLDTISFTNLILKKKVAQYEKTHRNISLMSTDDNILYLSKYLSTEAGSR